MHQWVQGVQGEGGGFMTAAEHKYKLRMWSEMMSWGQKDGEKMHILQIINMNVNQSLTDFHQAFDLNPKRAL